MNYLGVFSIVLAWAGLLFLILRWPGNKSMTFSQHAAQKKESRIFYRVLWTVATPIFTVFLLTNFKDKLDLNHVFNLLVLLASCGMLIAAYVAEVGGIRSKIHRIAAFSMAILFLPITLLIAASDNSSLFSKYFGAVSLMVLSIEVVILLISKGYYRFMLPVQASYILIFHLMILVAYYF